MREGKSDRQTDTDRDTGREGDREIEAETETVRERRRRQTETDVGPVVNSSASSAAGLGFDSHFLRGNFSGSSHTVTEKLALR